MTDKAVHIGTSGWQYDHWAGPFYPEEVPKTDWLDYYSGHFQTVEINNSLREVGQSLAGRQRGMKMEERPIFKDFPNFIRKKLPLLFAILILFLGLGSLAPEAAAQSPCGQNYTVVYSDTLRQIAQRCDTSLSALLAANPQITNPDMIFVGQQLEMPSPPADQTQTTTYTVKPGDTLRAIANRFDTSLAAILDLNPQITNPDLIYVDQRLTLPAEQEQSPFSVTISPASGPPGTTVRLTASGLPPNAPVEIGLGRKNTEFGVIEQARTDADGRLDTQVTIPEFADPNQPWVAVVSPLADPRMKATSNDFSVTEPQGDAPVFETVDIYLVSLENGELGCGDQLVAVERSVAPTQAPLTAAIQELLSLQERSVGSSGLYNALHSSDLQAANVEIAGGQATIHLTGELSLGGVCDTPRLEAQLRETALQFDSIDQVQIFVNGEPLADVTSARN